MSRPRKKRKITFDEEDYDDLHQYDVADNQIALPHRYAYKSRLINKYIIRGKISMRNEAYKILELTKCSKPGVTFGYKWSITFMYQANMTSRLEDGTLTYNDSDRAFQWLLWHNDGNINPAHKDYLSDTHFDHPERILFYDIEIMERLYLHDRLYHVPEYEGQIGVERHYVSQFPFIPTSVATVPPQVGEIYLDARISAHTNNVDMEPFDVKEQCVAFDRGNNSTAIWKTLKVKGKSQIQRKFNLDDKLEFVLSGQENSKFDIDAWITVQLFMKFDK